MPPTSAPRPQPRRARADPFWPLPPNLRSPPPSPSSTAPYPCPSYYNVTMPICTRTSFRLPDCGSICTTMAYMRYGHYRVLPLRKSFDGNFPQTCTTIAVPSPPSSPLTLSTPTQHIVSAHYTSSEAPQRSDEWFALRKDKLTTSTFSTALGFWQPRRRSELWREKVFPSDAIVFEASAKAAMNWGVLNEPIAIEHYKSITGRDVGSLGFAVHAEARYGWLGASPDGLLGDDSDCGILEVKCPYNKGKPELGLPWKAMPYYYMPQIQGLMEIMDRNWVDLYCWTPNGSTLFRVIRDRIYFEMMHEILADFWWKCVVPAREAVGNGSEAVAKGYVPKPRHELTNVVISRSRKLATEARLLCRDMGGNVEFYK